MQTRGSAAGSKHADGGGRAELDLGQQHRKILASDPQLTSEIRMTSQNESLRSKQIIYKPVDDLDFANPDNPNNYYKLKLLVSFI